MTKNWISDIDICFQALVTDKLNKIQLNLLPNIVQWTELLGAYFMDKPLKSIFNIVLYKFCL